MTAAVAFTACSAPSPASDSKSRGSLPTIATAATSNALIAPTATAGSSDTQPAINAYLGMWQDFVTAGRTSDWQSPLLADHATGDALLQMSRGLYADHYNGLITRGAPVDNPVVKSATPAADPTTVIITDCGDSSLFLKYYASTGQLAPEGAGGRQAITAEALKTAGGTWKIDRFAVEDVGTC
ncbi:MAG TPA: hypothetical protein VFE19_10805 [Jatrophihabitantaceae bacterium]|nr:hypothetical protein [Jatrophihabitantaceae bacterium]